MQKVISTRMFKLFILSLIIFAIIISSAVRVLAEGSVNLYPPEDVTLPAAAKPYRPYTEWFDNIATMAGMKRQQIIKVYAKAGETIFFGSSTHFSRFVDPTGTKEIRVTTPSGAQTYYDVVENGNGYINTLEKERIGPCYTDNGITKNSGGYTPLRIDVSETGVYIFEFFSPSVSVNKDPWPKQITELFDTQNGGTVGAWDVTVVKNLGVSGGDGNSETVTGRTFCNYLSMNMGANFYINPNDWGKGLYSTVYVLTDDGYIYKVEFNGMDPFGFLFFVNNRGLVNSETNTSLYHSARNTVKNNEMKNLKVTLKGGKDIYPVFHLPNAPDTVLDKTFKIFFEMPADDLPESIRATPYLPGKVTDFKFIGISDNSGCAGDGGFFSFNVTGGSSYQIKIEFAENYYDDRPANTLYISNACVPGYNRVFWDGRDGNGEIVPPGIYSSGESEGTIRVTVQVKAGECHFPLLDAESNPFGIKVELVNTPYKEDGTLYTWPSEEAEREARTKVYYDNSLIISNGSTNDPTVVGGITRGAIWAQINNQHNALGGISSLNGASKYMATTGDNASTLGGDYAFIDIWTYTIGEPVTLETSINNFELKDKNEVSTAQLKGLVYYDYNQDSYSAATTYNIQDGDYPLENITVELYDSHDELVATTYTDINGQYYFTDLTIDETHSVRVYAPYINNVFTTHNTGITTSGSDKYLTFSSGPLSSALNTVNNVGIHFDTYGITLQVVIEWAKNLVEDPTRPNEITVMAVGSFNGIDYVTIDAKLNAFNGWNHVFYNLPAKNDNGDELEYRIEETGVEGYIVFCK